MADNDLCRVETPLLVSVLTQSYDEKREIKGTNPQMAFNVLNVRFLDLLRGVYNFATAATIMQPTQAEQKQIHSNGLEAALGPISALNPRRHNRFCQHRHCLRVQSGDVHAAVAHHVDPVIGPQFFDHLGAGPKK